MFDIIDNHARIHPEDRKLLEEVLHQVHKLNRRIQEMTLATDKLVAAVAQLKDVETSAITALDGIPAIVQAAVAKALSDAGVDDTAAQAVIDQATSDATQVATDLKAAVVRDTPAAPAGGDGSAPSA
jgi:hypothetical protein